MDSIQINNPAPLRKRLFLQNFLASLSLYVLGMTLSSWSVGDFLQVALQLNYGEFGFTKRGLLGTLLHPILANADRATIHSAAVVYASIAGILLCVCVAELASRCRSRFHRALFLLSPATLLQLGYTFGFLDSTGTLILLSQILLLPAKSAVHRPRMPFRIGIISMLGVVATLTHEGWAISALPMLCVLMMRRTGRLNLVIATFIPALLALTAVALFGRFEGGDQQLAALLGRESNPVAMELTWSLRQNIQATIEGIWFSGNVKGSLTGFAYVAGLTWLAWRGTVIARNPAAQIALLATALSPLLLSFLGIDLGRWCGMAAFNLLLLGLLGEINLRGTPGSPWARLALLAGFAGPIGVFGHTFPLTIGALGRIF